MKIAFISGHRAISEEEFKEYYLPYIEEAIQAGHNFIVGDFEGLDLRAQIEIAKRGCADRLTVYHMLEHPRCTVKGINKVGGFSSDKERDEAMTAASDYDIAWVRPGKEKSGTAKNIIRRRCKSL